MQHVLQMNSESREPVFEHTGTGARDVQLAGLDRFLKSIERRALAMAELSTSDREEALDLVQDAMTNFVSRYGLHAESEWPPLFHRVLQNAMVDWGRRRTVRQGWLRSWPWVGGTRDSLRQDNDPALACRAPGPERTLGATQFGSDLQHALRTLPLRQRQVFLLRVWEGLDVAATAQALGIGAGSVKTHLSRALAQLREVLHEHA